MGGQYEGEKVKWGSMARKAWSDDIQIEVGRPEVRKSGCYCVKLEWCRVLEREEGGVLREQKGAESLLIIIFFFF